MHLKNFKNKSMQQPNNLISAEAIICQMGMVLVKLNKKVLDCKHTVIMGINLLSDDEGNVKKLIELFCQ